MSLHALATLEEAHEALISALDSSDVDVLERRVEELRAAIDGVRTPGGWRDMAEVKESAQRISRLGEAARVRVNFLADRTRQRLQTLSAVRGEAGAVVYAMPRRR